MDRYRIDQTSVDMAETANSLRIAANAADGYHAQQFGGTYGGASATQRLALACGIAEHSKVHFTVAMEAAQRIVDECVDNGENVAYQIKNVFCPGNPYETPFSIEVIEPEVMYDRVTGRPATAYTPPEDRVTRTVALANITAAVEDEHSHGGTPSLDDGCSS
jgi:hypothetical protein